MKTYTAALFFALVANSVIAGEVGALDPETSKAPSSFDVALAEIGASDRWEINADEFSVVPVGSASSRQLKTLNKHVGTINAKVSSQLAELIEVRVSQSLRH